MTTIEKIGAILSEYKGEDVEVTEETKFADLGFDSLDVVDLVMKFEDEFGVEIEMSPDLDTVGKIADLVDGK